MEPNSLKWVGSPCGLHGPYIFYKAFQYQLVGRPRILSLGDFFFVRCKPEEPICIAELQLLWEEKTSKQLLSSSKLYFLPENTPQGRTIDHGEDEVIAVSEKVIVKLEDLVKWTQSDFSKWKKGLRAVPLKSSVQKELGRNGQRDALQRYRQSTCNSGLNFKDVLKEKADLGEDNEENSVIILSYPQYCRYRAMVKRIQDRSSSLLTDQIVLALGGIAVINDKTQILYCRETFDHPTLIENECICEEFAPNLKGRPRKKKSCSQRRDSQVLNGVKDSNSNSEGKVVAKVKCEPKQTAAKPKNNNSNCKKVSTEDKSKAGVVEECRADEQAFLVALYKYMKERKTPIERIPYLGFKQINLWTMFQAAQKLGGYETITARRQWKNVYDELGGNPGSTSAATCTRRHYERLILPYERFIKGEEDKPLPPVKPRKQENNSQEGESKMKMSGAKRNKTENQKGKKEKESAIKADDTSGVSSVKENDQDSADQKSLIQLQKTEVAKTEVERQHSPLPDVKGSKPLEKAESNELDLSSDKIIEETQQPVCLSSPCVPTEEATASTSSVKQLQIPTEGISNIKQEQQTQSFMDKLGSELQEISSNIFPTAQTQFLSQNTTQDQKVQEMSEYIANSSIKGDQSTREEIKNHVDNDALQNGLKHNPTAVLGNSSDALKEKDLPVSVKDDPSSTYTPVLYSRGNPGIMSPLAKKKLLSQVSGTTLSNSYPYGSPPPLISKKKPVNNRDETSAPGINGSQASTTETLLVNRPSVIQHAHSFKSKNSEDKKTADETFKHDASSKSDSQPCDFSKHHLSSLADRYGIKSDIQECKDRTPEKRSMHSSQAHSFLADFYSSPHLHSLYRHTEHHLNNEQAPKYVSRDLMFREPENVSTFSQHKHQEKVSVNYCQALHQQEKRTTVEAASDDQPTDLSLPKASQKQSPKVLISNHPHSLMQQEGKTIPHFQATTSKAANIDCNPKACRVTPITMATPKKLAEPHHRISGKPHNPRLDDSSLRKMEGMVQPVMSNKSSPQNIGAARPLKRNLEDNDSISPEKKIRAVSPLHFTKETSMKEKASDEEAEGSKSLHSAQPVNHLESHKLPGPTPIFQGLYPGAFVSQVQDMCAGLGTRFPAGYTHSLQYLKNQAMFSPLMQPLAIHSFMMQRQFLTSSATSPQFYRHLTSATPVGASYGDILHNTIYPLAAINPQTSFTPSQLSSVHPSTKL